MMKYYLLLVFLITNVTLTLAATSPNVSEYRACLVHGELYEIVNWAEQCDTSMVGYEVASDHPGSNNGTSNPNIITGPGFDDEIPDPTSGDDFGKFVPHNPECFTSQPYQ